MRESQAIRLDALEWREQAKTERWLDGIRERLTYRALRVLLFANSGAFRLVELTLQLFDARL